MGKYDRLADFLTSHTDATWDARFEDVERVIQTALPPSASTYREWWANQSGAGHSQARAWMGTGWRIGKVELENRRVEFRRVGLHDEARKSAEAAANDENADLFSKAAHWAGIEDRETLVRAGLTALIQQEAGRRLALRGGTMPQFEAAPRRRPA